MTLFSGGVILVARASPWVRLSTAITGSMLVSIGLHLGRRSPALGPTDSATRFFLLVLILTPTWSLSTVTATIGNKLGLHVLTLAALLLQCVTPALIAWFFASQPYHIVVRVLKITLLSILILAVAFGILEVVLRQSPIDFRDDSVWRLGVDGPMYEPSDIVGLPYTFQPNYDFAHVYSSNERGYFDEDNSITYHINTSGFRGDDFSSSPSQNSVQIAFLGDSYGFSPGVRLEDTVPEKLESILQEANGCELEAYNFSVPGYSTSLQAVQLRQVVMAYEPDIVVVWYTLRRFDGVGTIGLLGGDDPPLFFPTGREHSIAIGIVGSEMDARLGAYLTGFAYRRAYRDEDQWNSTIEGLSELSNVATEMGTPIVLFVHPILIHLDERYPFSEIHEQVIDAAINENIIPYDLFDAFEGLEAESLWVHQSDQHPNENANSISARFAAGKLLPLLPICS